MSQSTLVVTQEVLDQIAHTIGLLPAETGGMLGGRNGIVTDFYFDGTASRTASTYSPDTPQVNRLLSQEWNLNGIELLGFIHSHPRGFLQPSGGDLAYARAILAANSRLDRVLLPIVSSRASDGEFTLQPFIASKNGADVRLDQLQLEIVAAPSRQCTRDSFVGEPMFDRVRAAVDLHRLERCRVIAVGCGGAASFIEDLARSGVGEFVLVDPDVVTETNLATQQTYRRDIGRPKVDCIAERIRDVNPLAFVVAVSRRLDELNDIEICYLARTPFRSEPPVVSLLCGMTDDFYAQARVNRLALTLELPSLCAQVYAEGRGAEVTFTHPDTPHACHRCMLRSWYRAYLEEGFVNPVGSGGSPFYATARLNTLKQFVALALFHHGSAHPRWGEMLKRIGQRNLVQLRLDPGVNLPAVRRVFADAGPELFSDDPIWLPQEADEHCGDCLGTGDWRSLRGRLDTELLPRRGGITTS